MPGETCTGFQDALQHTARSLIPSFVVKKLGLIRATAKYGNETGEGHAYLKSWLWWVGMIMMIIGEICNFVA